MPNTWRNDSHWFAQSPPRYQSSTTSAYRRERLARFALAARASHSTSVSANAWIQRFPALAGDVDRR